MNINRTIIVPAALAPLARALAASLSAGGVGMFETALCTGTTITHYVSSGWLDASFDALLPMHSVEIVNDIKIVTPPTQAAKDTAASNMYAAAVAKANSTNPPTEVLVTPAQCAALVNASTVIDCDVEGAQGTFDRLGLRV